MYAARFHGIDDLRVDDIDPPEPGPGDVLLAPLAVGVCGTDTHILAGHYPATNPVTLGHEVAARVLAIGSDVEDVQVGDLITVEPHRYCGKCKYCRRGLEHMCIKKEAYGVHLDGGMAEHMVIPARIAYRLPQDLDPAIGALTEPLSCCLHAMDRLAPLAGLPILIIGAGPAGAMLIALAKQAGLGPVVAADLRADRRGLATRMGADVVLDPAADDYEQRALDLTDGDGFPYTVDAVGSPAILETCIRLGGRAGRVLVFGVANPAARASISPQDVYARELTILGSAINPYTHLRATAMLQILPLDQLRIATYPLAKVHEALEAAEAGTTDKVQLNPQAVSSL